MSEHNHQPTLTDEPAPRPRKRSRAKELLAGLNDPQREAVLHRGSPLLVVAGAGSGKTRVLTRRIAYLVSERDAHPGSILAITFTNKAAAEMRHRVAEIIGNRARIMWVSTFHSACVRILRAEIHRFGYARQFSIYDDADAKRLMQLVCSELGLDPKKHPVRQVLNWVSNCKNDLVDHEAARSRAAAGQELYPEAYANYQRRLRAANALDFDDLIMLTVHLFQAFPEVWEHYRRRFRHVLVDEYQDTNHAQYVLIRELCGVREGELAADEIDPPELMVVGDSDQSIYAFRGATIRNILDFATDFPGARTVMLEQNYRSTQTVLSAANAVISHNEGRPAKNLWSAAGDGDRVVGYVADTEHDEAQFVAGEIQDLAAAGTSTYADTAVFYRTNAQSRAFEEVFIRRGVPYKVVGGVRFYERKEVRDVIAYLRAIVNRADDVSVRRILNVPKRGIGDRAEAAIEAFAQRESISFGDALRRASESGLAAASVRRLQAFADMMDEHEELVAGGTPAHEVVASILGASGYLAELEASNDPQDQTRVENLAEFLAVAEEFVTSASAVSLDETEPGFDLATEDGLLGAPEPDPSLAAFLERIALVSDADQLGSAGQATDGAESQSVGVVTLMTLHTAKGLEFDTVFLTGCEDGILPHQRTVTDLDQLAEERRLTYVGITRARKRLYLSRAVSRSAWGAPQHNPPSRFLAEIPDRLLDWRRLGSAQTTWRNTSATARYRERNKRDGFGTRIDTVPVKRDVPELTVGDRVLHNAFGLGSVVALHGSGAKALADVDFGSGGVRRLALQFAPLEKL
ncbi:DNA helicase PcrA [Granulicoccus sp. GXG6511]|uniref:DNA helicase PcrA n=1 Tax=Granulicoccus sp. GXG6511 TaxID=3381351 RepID=UPI003D7EB6BE